MSQRSEFLQERDPMLNDYVEVVMIAEMTVRQEYSFCSYADNTCEEITEVAYSVSHSFHAIMLSNCAVAASQWFRRVGTRSGFFFQELE